MGTGFGEVTERRWVSTAPQLGAVGGGGSLMQNVNHCPLRNKKSLVTQILPLISDPRNTKPVIQEPQTIPFLQFYSKQPY